jgi:hypothetical protein
MPMSWDAAADAKVRNFSFVCLLSCCFSRFVVSCLTCLLVSFVLLSYSTLLPTLLYPTCRLFNLSASPPDEERERTQD